MSNPRLVALLAGLIVATAAGSAFVIGREIFSKDAPVQAQSAPEATPVIVNNPPHPNLEKLVEDSKKPRFVGLLNGVTIYDPAAGPPEMLEECTAENFRALIGDEAAAAARSSPLNFQPDYLPAGARMVHEELGTCAGALVSINRSYSWNGPGVLSISHSRQPPHYIADTPADRLEATTIAGLPSLVWKPVFPGAPARIVMRDGNSQWLIGGDFTLAELVKIAEGLR